jgi:membrane-bound metal-dependent hydrolase YbcI (DUF457 family)
MNRQWYQHDGLFISVQNILAHTVLRHIRTRDYFFLCDRFGPHYRLVIVLSLISKDSLQCLCLPSVQRNLLYLLEQAWSRQPSLHYVFLFLLRPGRWRQYVPPKFPLTFIGLHRIILQKAVTLHTHFCVRPFLNKRWHNLLRHYATCPKFAVSITHEVICFFFQFT